MKDEKTQSERTAKQKAVLTQRKYGQTVGDLIGQVSPLPRRGNPVTIAVECPAVIAPVGSFW